MNNHSKILGSLVAAVVAAGVATAPVQAVAAAQGTSISAHPTKAKHQHVQRGKEHRKGVLAGTLQRKGALAVSADRKGALSYDG